MKIYRSEELAILYRSFRFARRNTLAIGMLGLFPFDRSTLSGLHSEQQLWPLVAEVLGADAILDEGFPKPAAEFKLYGSAHAPHAQPVREMLVAAQLGSLRKQLLVSGDRHFERSGLISAAASFQSMPLRPQQAFGGADCVANVVGKGAHAIVRADGSTHWPLPNVELPRQRMLSRDDVPDPAGFWGFDATVPLRCSQLGQFDQHWMQHTWPHLPDDTGSDYFHSAPLDQRFATYLHGDESFSLQGLHPQHGVLSGRLPGLRARCFVNRKQADGVAVLHEIAARLETVWLFPEHACGIVLYRAQCEIADEDAADVLHVMAEWENLQDLPRSFNDYQADFERKLSVGPMPVVVIPDDSSPAVEAALIGPPPFAAVADEVTPELRQLQDTLAQLQQETSLTMSKYGMTQQDLAPYLKPPVEPEVPSLEKLEQMIAHLNQEVRGAMQKHQLSDADLAPYLNPPVQKEVSLQELKGLLGDLEQQTSAAMAKHGLTEQGIVAALGAKPELAEALKHFKKNQAQRMSLSDIPDDIAAADSAEAMPTAALPTREQVIAWHAAGKSLAALELSGLNLSALDLSGADFSGSLLEKTLFTDTLLVKANFSACLMQGVDCNGADLSGARLSGVSAAGSSFVKARLLSAQLDDADFNGADFSCAQLQQALLDGASFENAVLTQVQAAACSARQAHFNGADLCGADFSKALLTQADFSGGKLGGTNFSSAQCEHAQFYGSDACGAQFSAAALARSRADAETSFAQADFSDAQLCRASWAGVQLSGARFVGARLDDADFSHVSAVGTNFRLACATGAKFAKADLSQADLSGINLFNGSLRKARVDDAVWHFANLYGVDFEGVVVRVAALEGANTEQTILAMRAPLA